MRGPLRFAPPVAWMGVIALLSSDLFSADQTGEWLLPLLATLLPEAPDVVQALHAVLRKLGHLVEYAVLGLLWFRALAPADPTPRAGLAAVALAALFAVVDEARQGLTAHRSPAMLDVGLDTLGAALAVASRANPQRVGSWLARLGCWAAAGVALGSLALAALDWSLGRAGWPLSAAAVGAGLAAWALHRLGRPAPARDRPAGVSPAPRPGV